MPSQNSVFLIGHIGSEPQIRQTKNGKQVAELSLATNRGRDDEKRTEWHKVIAWGPYATSVAEGLNKGDEVIVVNGELRYNEWTPEGSKYKRKDAEIHCFLLLKSEKVRRDTAQNEDGEEIPF